jgi:hypothetical protein
MNGTTGMKSLVPTGGWIKSVANHPRVCLRAMGHEQYADG